MSNLSLQGLREAASEKFKINEIDPKFVADFIFNSLSFKTDLKGENEVLAIVEGKVDGIDKETVILVQNQMNGFKFILNSLEEDKQFNENTLKDLHEIVLGDTEIGGLYRNVDISIRGSNHTPPSHLKVYDRMKKYFDKLENHEGCVFEKIAYSYVQLAKIHPFFLGNGRTARLVLNYQLMKHGLVPIIILHSDKVNYFNYLEEYKVNKNILPFKKYIKSLVVEALELDVEDCSCGH